MDKPHPKDNQWPNADKIQSNCTQIYPLDRMLKFYFIFKGRINLDYLDSVKEFFKYNEQFQNKIVQFLIQMVEKVCSAAFYLLVNNKCNENQAKCYASKNMLENIKYLSLEVSRIIKGSQQRNKQENGGAEKLEQLTRDIASFICQEIKVYIQQIFPKYPSTPLSGYSQKLKNAIRSIDRRQDFTYDFLHIHKVQIGDAKSTQELISQIMEFLNKVKNAPYEKIEGGLNENREQETYEECFQKFNRNLVWIISQKSITEQLINGETILSAKGKESKKFSFTHLLKKISSKIQNTTSQKRQEEIQNSCLFQFLASPSQRNLLRIMKSFKGHQRQTQDWELIQKYQQDLKKYQKEHKFLANAKIPMNTQQFQRSEINNAQLRFKNSGLLRVVVKWVEDLQETLKDSKKYVRDNGFKFKIKKSVPEQETQQKQTQMNGNEDLIALNQQKRKILELAIKKASLLNNNKQSSNKINMFLVDSLMEQEQQIPHYNFQNSLKLSSQVNSYIGKQTVEQLIKLIGVFGKISQNYIDQAVKEHIEKKKENKDNYSQKIQSQKPKLIQELKRVSLVSNRIGDLLRSKIFCTESQFIKLLTLLYEFDKYCLKSINSNPSIKDKEKFPFFKIIRIKNKLKQTTNNVHINYMFYGKIQCQLQICFLNNKNIQNANQTMHHFLYELKRGIYGVVPQLANIVNQNDPICKQNQSSNLNFIKYSQKVFKHHQFQERKISLSQKNRYIVRCVYKGCNQLSLQRSKKFIKEDQKQFKNQCLKCYIQKNKSQKNLFDCLKQLQYSHQDQWMQEIFEKRTELQIQEIRQNEQMIPGVYLVICPMQKRVNVEIYIIFKHYKTGKLIIKCLDQNRQNFSNNQKALEFQTQKAYKEHKSMKKLYLKANRFQLRKYLQQFNNNNKNNKASFYLKNLSKKQIRSLQLLAVKQFDSALLAKQIQNKQEHIRLIQMQSIKNQLQICFQKKQQLMFVQRVYAQQIQLQKWLPISKFSNLKELHLKKNQLSGLINIQNHPFVTYIDLSFNEITKIELRDLKCLKNLNLDFNRKLQFDFKGLTSLQILSMMFCELSGQVSFRKQLQSLQILNVQNNKITKLDLSNCPSLKNLNCKHSQQHSTQLIFNEKISLKQIKAKKVKDFKYLKLDQLQTVELTSDTSQILQFAAYLRDDNHLQDQINKRIYSDPKFDKRQLLKLKNIEIRLFKNKQQSKQQWAKLIQWQNNAMGQLLQWFIANQPNLSSLLLGDLQYNVLIQHLDLSRVQQQIQYLHIQSYALKSLKLNKVTQLGIDSPSLNILYILNPQSLKQFRLLHFNNQILSRLAKVSFYKQLTNIQLIRIFGKEPYKGEYEFTNARHLKNIDCKWFNAYNLILIDHSQQQPMKKPVGKNPQELQLWSGLLDRGCIKLSQLKELNIRSCSINNFKITIPLKSIKKIRLTQVKILNLQILYYDENEKADLQFLTVDGDSLALLKAKSFFKKVNSIKHLALFDPKSNKQKGLSVMFKKMEQQTLTRIIKDPKSRSKEQIRLSLIYEKMEQLTIIRNCQRVIIDTSIKTINIKQSYWVAEFEFDYIMQASQKRQKLTISLSQSCLLTAKFINKTNQVIEVAIKAKGFKSFQTFKEKNRGQKIMFTFISEQQAQYLKHEQEDKSQKQQDLQQQLQRSRKSLNILQFNELQVTQDLINEQNSIQSHQQNNLTKRFLYQCPQYKQLLKSYEKQLKKLQQDQRQAFINEKKNQFQQYEQLRQKCYKYLQENRLNEFKEEQIGNCKQQYLRKLKQRIKKCWKLRESLRHQLLKKYLKEVQEDLAKMSEDKRKELQKDLDSYHTQEK